MNKNIETLLNLVKENPELRIVPMVDRENCQDDNFQYWLGSFGECAITKMYNDIDNERVFLEDDIEDLVLQYMDNNYGTCDISDRNEKQAEEIVNNYNWEKVIVVYIELPWEVKMNELDLYKFCQDKEMHWHKDELLIFINFYDLKEFVEVIGKSCFDDDGIQVTMKDHYIGLDLAPICESWDVDPERIYSKDND